MCRLFGLNAGQNRINVCFWLLGAPDSLSEQSQVNRDVTGLGWFDKNNPILIDEQPLSAFDDADFALEAKE